MKKINFLIIFSLLTILSVHSLAAMGESEEQTRTQPSQPGTMIVRPGHDFAVLQGADLFTGITIDASLLRKNTVTLINIWATTCPACIRKMPDLAELQKILPDGAGILGIVLDGSTRPGDAKEILEAYKASFPNIIPHSSMRELLYRTAPYIPASVLVDSSGKILSGPHYGLKDIQEYITEFNKHL